MRQKLGQHFLQDTAQLARVADYALIGEGDTVIEIGPGHGELTAYLVAAIAHAKNASLILIERDAALILGLRKKFAPLLEKGAMKIEEGNAVEILPTLAANLRGAQYKIVGNIPYYLTGFLFRVIGELPYKPVLSVFTIQKEVAERLTAQPPHMNLLAASIQYWADAELLDIVPKDSFSPPPEVDSAVIRLATLPKQPAAAAQDHFYACIHALFKQPRKTIGNNLRQLPTFAALPKEAREELFKKIGHSSEERPQDMHIKSISLLAHLLYNE